MNIQIGTDDANAIYINGEFVIKINIGNSTIKNMNLENLYFLLLDNFNLGKLDELNV